MQYAHRRGDDFARQDRTLMSRFALDIAFSHAEILMIDGLFWPDKVVVFLA
jgi:hypothetical protein